MISGSQPSVGHKLAFILLRPRAWAESTQVDKRGPISVHFPTLSYSSFFSLWVPSWMNKGLRTRTRYLQLCSLPQVGQVQVAAPVWGGTCTLGKDGGLPSCLAQHNHNCSQTQASPLVIFQFLDILVPSCIWFATSHQQVTYKLKSWNTPNRRTMRQRVCQSEQTKYLEFSRTSLSYQLSANFQSFNLTEVSSAFLASVFFTWVIKSVEPDDL